MYCKNLKKVNRELGKLKYAEQTIDAVVSVKKSEHVLFTKRTHARRVATYLGNVNQNTSGVVTLLRVQHTILAFCSINTELRYTNLRLMILKSNKNRRNQIDATPHA